MNELNESIQKMIYWIEEYLGDNPTLGEMSAQIGYSPFYCSAKFHDIVGMTIRSYISGRRLAKATLDIRDTKERILDIAVKYGYSSQEALTRAFMSAYGCTPASYRRHPRPVPISIMQTILFPEQYIDKGEITMSKTCLTEATVRTEYIPAHRYLGIKEERTDNYCDFWKYHECDSVCGTIDSLSNISHPIVTCHTAGWYKKADGSHGYLYGLGVQENYDGDIPEGFELIDVPGGYYLVFCHPPFDFLKDCGEVMQRVETLAWNYDISKCGFGKTHYQWDEDARPCYQRHYPEEIGYEILRPIKMIEK